MLHYPPDELAGLPFTHFIHPRDLLLFQTRFDQRVAGLDPPRRYDLRLLRHPDVGGFVEIELHANLIHLNGQPCVLGTVNDITLRVAAMAEAERAAFRDRLTGLGNRQLLLRHIEELIARSDGSALCVLVVDIDRFRALNGGLGHSAGDAVLRRFAGYLQNIAGEVGFLARLGNDEFGLVLPDLATEDDLIQQLLRVMGLGRIPLALEDRTISITTCAGYFIAGEADVAADECLRNAELALEQARLRGPGSIAGFTPGLRSESVTRQRLDAALADALTRGELHLHFQPIVDAANRSLAGFEALARWHHPQEGNVTPDRFIPLAEASGRIHEIGAFVLTEAARQLADWRARFGTAADHLTMSVNVSNRQFDQGEALAALVANTLQRFNLPPERLKLEITESALINEPERVIAIIDRIAALGISWMIDDFGTGYSSFTRLRRLPVSTLKVDRAFVQDADRPGRGREIVAAIAAMARRLGLSIIAEGVETADQSQMLHDLGCDLLQGFFFARPQTPDRIAADWLGQTPQ